MKARLQPSALKTRAFGECTLPTLDYPQHPVCLALDGDDARLELSRQLAGESHRSSEDRKEPQNRRGCNTV